MEKNRSRIPTIADYAAYGIRIGAMLLGIAATIALAYHILTVYQAGTGRIGWELTAPSAYACALYLGWSFGLEYDRQRRSKARRKRREEAAKYAGAAGRSTSTGSEGGSLQVLQ